MVVHDSSDSPPYAELPSRRTALPYAAHVVVPTGDVLIPTVKAQVDGRGRGTVLKRQTGQTPQQGTDPTRRDLARVVHLSVTALFVAPQSGLLDTGGAFDVRRISVGSTCCGVCRGTRSGVTGRRRRVGIEIVLSRGNPIVDMPFSSLATSYPSAVRFTYYATFAWIRPVDGNWFNEGHRLILVKESPKLSPEQLQQISLLSRFS